MKKFLAFITTLALAVPHTGYALSDSEYEILKENSAEFADADNRLGTAWKNARAKVSETEKDLLLKDQRKWIKDGWDARAKQLMSDQQLKRTNAYIQAIEERIQYLDNYRLKKLNTPVDQKTVTVEAEGSGTSKLDALQAAWMDAVRKAVGMFMTAKSEVINDEITEKIVTHSRGQVNAYKVLEENQVDGVWNITISANVDRDIIQEIAKPASKTTTVKFDGSNIAASKVSVSEKNKSATELVGEAAKILSIEDILDFDTKIYTQKSKNDGKDEIIAQSILKVNLKKFQKQVDELEKIISKIAIKEEIIQLNTNVGRETLAYIKKQDYKQRQINVDGGFWYTTDGKWQLLPDYRTGFPIVDDKIPADGICFFKNIGSAKCYIVPSEAKNALADKSVKGYKLLLNYTLGDGIDATVISASPNITIVYPFISYISPVIRFIEGGGLTFYNCAVFEVFNKLNLNNDDLINHKEIKCSYELKPER